MHTTITRVLVAVAAGMALSTLGLTGASVSGAATSAPQAVRAAHAATVPGAQLWVKRYNGPGNVDDQANSLAVSPGGGTVFVTGTSAGATSGLDYATFAYNTVTGAQRWVKRYNGPGNREDQAYSVAVSPTGGTVFVTGTSKGVSSNWDYATVAYNAATGAQLWVKRYNGPGNRDDIAYSMAVSPGGGTVLVTGQSAGTASGDDYATVAYNAATGARLWVARYNGPRNRIDEAHSMAVSPGGGTVFVTGTSREAGSNWDYATVAYNTATGAQLWVKRYNRPGNREDGATSLAVGPGGGTVYVTGSSVGSTSQYDYATVAYNAATGAQRWVKRYNGPGNGADFATSLAVGPGGGTVYVTGSSVGSTSQYDYATVAYNAATGAQRWVKRYNGFRNGADFATSLTVGPGGGTVYVTGSSAGKDDDDYATAAYNAVTGARQWVTRYNGPRNLLDFASDVAVSPTGGMVFVTGSSMGDVASDYATVAYKG